MDEVGSGVRGFVRKVAADGHERARAKIAWHRGAEPGRARAGDDAVWPLRGSSPCWNYLDAADAQIT